jgi:SecD/SecF fusion protein
MRNKGFFWFLTLLLTVICIYQLSFTWVSNGVEKQAEKEARAEVEILIEKSKANGNKGILPNSLNEIDFSKAESKEIAVADIINFKLSRKADKSVFLGSTFAEVKNRSLAFGLDLVGGMSVTMEVSIPDLVKNYIRNENDIEFKRAFRKAESEAGDGNFIETFVAAHQELNPGKSLVGYMNHSDIEELNRNSSDDEVLEFLLEKRKSSMKGVKDIMERRINQFGVAQPNIQIDEDNNRIYIELPGVQDEATVAAKLVSTANLQFYETWDLSAIQGVMTRANQLSMSPELKASDLEDIANAAANDSIDADGNVILEELRDKAEDDDVTAEILKVGADGFKGLASLMVPYGNQYFVKMNDRATVERLLKQRKDIAGLFPKNLLFMWDAATMKYPETKETGYLLYAIKTPLDGKAKVGGKDIKKASTGYDSENGSITVNVDMTEEGSAKWAQMTADNVERQVAITMDSVVYSAPNVKGAIKGGSTEISGTFTIDEANDLSGLLNGGALPAPCIIKEQSKVGPTIGAENSRAGLMSFGFALLLVFAYMIFYYGKAGIVADIALIANILFIFGSLASFGAVLTLAGIAGIVLTIGMAVDANVLIFERIREEQASGKDLKTSIDTGFKKALTSIIDANVTTLLTAIVLKSFGSGAIESFATTLIIGIFTSVFAALVITRLCISWWLKSGKTINFESKLTKNAFKNFKIDFVGKRKSFYILSTVLVIGSVVAIFTRELSPSVEFSGGHSYTIKFDNSTEGHSNLIKANLNKVLVDEKGKVASTTVKTKSNSFILEVTTNFKKDGNPNKEVKEKLEEGLALSESKVGKAEVQESRSVTSSISDELLGSSMLAVAISLLIIFAYILIRFGKWQYSTGAIIAMAHDVTLVLGIFALFHGILPFNMDIDQAFVAAILTVIGYSINDTVIVFDRIRENLRMNKNTNENDEINRSLNSTLSRTINTSMTTFIVLLIIFLFGGGAIKGFIFALMVGVIVGTYSSVCIATPILIDFSKKSKKGLKEPEPVVIETAEV